MDLGSEGRGLHLQLEETQTAAQSRTEARPMQSVSTFVGLDVHKSSISVAFASSEYGSEPVFAKRLPNDLELLLKLLRSLGAPEEIRVCYEAGPTGYGLYRALRDLGYDCCVIAPAKTPKSPTDKVKTDRIDSLRLAECLRNGQLTEIRVPTSEEEALRDLLRAREDFKEMASNTKRRILSMLLRYGRIWTGKSTWTKAHREWISAQKFDHAAATEAHDDYIEMLDTLEERIGKLELLIHETALRMPMAGLYRAFMTLKGVKVIVAATLIAEIGDFRRFATAAHFMSFLGLTPSIYASGDGARRGRITKAGNARLRRLLTEAAWAYFRTPHKSRDLLKRSEGIAEQPLKIAWEAQRRLHRKITRLRARGKNQKMTLIAGARELAGFIWAMGQQEVFLADAA
jgi:transposase